jgi:hypothetical protein
LPFDFFREKQDTRPVNRTRFLRRSVRFCAEAFKLREFQGDPDMRTMFSVGMDRIAKMRTQA